jgi:hypothetical protein
MQEVQEVQGVRVQEMQKVHEVWAGLQRVYMICKQGLCWCCRTMLACLSGTGWAESTAICQLAGSHSWAGQPAAVNCGFLQAEASHHTERCERGFPPARPFSAGHRSMGLWFLG